MAGQVLYPKRRGGGDRGEGQARQGTRPCGSLLSRPLWLSPLSPFVAFSRLSPCGSLLSPPLWLSPVSLPSVTLFSLSLCSSLVSPSVALSSPSLCLPHCGSLLSLPLWLSSLSLCGSLVSPSVALSSLPLWLSRLATATEERAPTPERSEPCHFISNISFNLLNIILFTKYHSEGADLGALRTLSLYLLCITHYIFSHITHVLNGNRSRQQRREPNPHRPRSESDHCVYSLLLITNYYLL
jgi:hypothetical protein